MRRTIPRCPLVALVVVATSCSGFTRPDECNPGETMSCESQCGPGVMRCEPDGTFGACEIAGTHDCLPGEIGTCEGLPGQPPGLWLCSDTCEIGPCLDLCLPGETFDGCETECGTGSATCQDDGSWGPCLDYVIPPCRPGQIETCVDEPGHRRCEPGCDWGPCEVGPCTPGEVARCGDCASQVCQADGSWGACTADEAAECAPGEREACDAPCGPGDRVCGADCTWSACYELEVVPCHPGQRQMCPTTLYCGLAYRLCSSSCQWMDCIETGD